MPITYDPEEYIAALGDLTPLVNQPGGYQGTIDILNQFAGNKGSGSYNIPNGGFTMPTTVSPFSSGLNYAQSIAGGQNVPNMIAPGISYSAEQPGGYTQADLNGTPPPPPPVYKEPDDPSFFGTGIGGVTIPGGRRDKMPPLRNIFGNQGGGLDNFVLPPGYKEGKIGNNPPRDPAVGLARKAIRQDLLPPPPPPQEFDIEQITQNIADSGIDFTNLFGLPQAPDLSQFVTKDDLPNGRDFSIDQFDLPDFSEFALRKDLPVYQEPDLSGFARIEDLPTFNPDELRKDIMMSLPEQKMQDLSGFMTQDDINKAIAGIDIPSYQAPDLSGFMTQDDINKAIAGINMPTYEQPDLSAYDTRLAELEQSLAALQQPTGGRFSINQPQVRGLF
jgi:hypothetical protein